MKTKLLGSNKYFISIMVTGLTPTEIEKKYTVVGMGFKSNHSYWVVVAVGNVLTCGYIDILIY